jgi:hypothetical protein
MEPVFLIHLMLSRSAFEKFKQIPYKGKNQGVINVFDFPLRVC